MYNINTIKSILYMKDYSFTKEKQNKLDIIENIINPKYHESISLTNELIRKFELDFEIVKNKVNDYLDYKCKEELTSFRLNNEKTFRNLYKTLEVYSQKDIDLRFFDCVSRNDFGFYSLYAKIDDYYYELKKEKKRLDEKCLFLLDSVYSIEEAADCYKQTVNIYGIINEKFIYYANKEMEKIRRLV